MHFEPGCVHYHPGGVERCSGRSTGGVGQGTLQDSCPA
ncbi:unnamed protein product [Linum tenue]|uniref:Uncharacterized protein n=1 Tax=Linum tenue TaxID=586396 RepID=A0AAV0KTV9_9ROSI|nr:unnamed protein product [Linum tenue]